MLTERKSILIAAIQQAPMQMLVELTKAMDAKINDLQKHWPKMWYLKPYYVQADFVNDSIKECN